MQKAVEERGEEWLQAVVQYHIEGGYGKVHHLQGYEGYIACLVERQKRGYFKIINLHR